MFRSFSQEVDKAEYERDKRRNDLREYWIKVVTMIAALIAAVTGVLNYLQH